jgi:hypothetical protein
MHEQTEPAIFSYTSFKVLFSSILTHWGVVLNKIFILNNKKRLKSFKITALYANFQNTFRIFFLTTLGLSCASHLQLASLMKLDVCGNEFIIFQRLTHRTTFSRKYIHLHTCIIMDNNSFYQKRLVNH